MRDGEKVGEKKREKRAEAGEKVESKSTCLIVNVAKAKAQNRGGT